MCSLDVSLVCLSWMCSLCVVLFAPFGRCMHLTAWWKKTYRWRIFYLCVTAMSHTRGATVLGAPRVSLALSIFFIAAKSKTSENSIFSSEFEETKNSPNNRRWLKFGCNFSLRNFFVLTISRSEVVCKSYSRFTENVFLQNLSKFMFVIFPNNYVM